VSAPELHQAATEAWVKVVALAAAAERDPRVAALALEIERKAAALVDVLSDEPADAA